MPPEQTRGKTAAEIAAADDAAPTRNETPRTGEVVSTQQDSRLNALRDAPPRIRAQLVWLSYEGRKGSRGTVRRTQDEHIDVLVPDDANPQLVDAYLDQVSPGGVLTEAAREELKKAGISADSLHISGSGYHFLSAGAPTPVLPEHAAWLLAHPGYSFKKTDEPR